MYKISASGSLIVAAFNCFTFSKATTIAQKTKKVLLITIETFRQTHTSFFASFIFKPVVPFGFMSTNRGLKSFLMVF